MLLYHHKAHDTTATSDARSLVVVHRQDPDQPGDGEGDGVRQRHDDHAHVAQLHQGRHDGREDEDCPRRKPPFSAVKRPARPYRSAIQYRFTQENANGA